MEGLGVGGGLGCHWWPLSVRGGGDVTLRLGGCALATVCISQSTQEESCPHFIDEDIGALQSQVTCQGPWQSLGLEYLWVSLL